MKQPAPGGQEDLAEISRKLAFTRKLQGVANKIHATKNIDEIMLEVSQDVCTLMEADRLTIYVLNEEKNAIVSRVKTGLNAFKDLKLPLTAQSIAGYAGVYRQLLNIADVYDSGELNNFTPAIHFLKDVDLKTGYRTKQMLVAPIVDAEDKGLLGVIQLINTLSELPFPQLAEEGVEELAKTMAIALKQRQQPLHLVRSKYDGLVTENIISADELALAMRSARKKSLSLEDILIEEFQVSGDALRKSYAGFFHVPAEPFRADRIKPADLLANLKRDYVETSQWLPLEETQEGLVILTPDPESVGASRIVANVFPKQRKLIYKVCTQREFAQTLDLFFGATMDIGSIGDVLSQLEDQGNDGEHGDDDTSVDAAAAADNELVKLVNKIIIDGYNKKASDIHVEPGPGKAKTLIRMRIDGSLMPYIEVPSSYRNALVTRLKIMCDLDISEKRKPQDGKIKFKRFGPLDIELRVATIPSAGGVEDVVMRILAAGEPLPLEKLALSQRNLEQVKGIVSKPYGLFFVCGPTGSGKTTTLHSILKHINTSDTKIWTAEDPVEITQKGLRQVQMNPKAGLTFAVAMRAFLRADPDVIMVGEMRDKETVSTGIEASLTGHLVFSTLHTNSAPESVIRLLDMGMDPFNFADALLGVLAQRLGKRLCSCKQGHVASEAEMQSMLKEFCAELEHTDEWKRDAAAASAKVYQEWKDKYADGNGQFTLYSAVGCEQCNGTGYKGRVGLHELLAGTDAVKKNIQEHARVAEIVATALEEGMRTLKQDGMDKVLQGITDMKSVRAVCIK